MKIKWDKKNYKWVYNAGVKPQASIAYSQNTHKTGKKKSKWMIFLMALVAVLLVFTVMISVLDLKSRNRDTLSVMKIETDNPEFVGTYRYGGGGKSTSSYGMRVVARNGLQYHVMRGDIPMSWPNQHLEAFDRVLAKTIPVNFQNTSHPHIKVVSMTSLVWGQFKNDEDMEKLMQRLHRKGFRVWDAQSGPVYVLPIEMVYWQNGKKFHYLRPEREYADKLNSKCPSCLKDTQALGSTKLISAQ